MLFLSCSTTAVSGCAMSKNPISNSPPAPGALGHTTQCDLPCCRGVDDAIIFICAITRMAPFRGKSKTPREPLSSVRASQRHSPTTLAANPFSQYLNVCFISSTGYVYNSLAFPLPPATLLFLQTLINQNQPG